MDEIVGNELVVIICNHLVGDSEIGLFLIPNVAESEIELLGSGR